MSANQQNVPKKGDIIINPKTQRPVKVGSRTWLNLVKEGLISGHYKDPKELEQVPEEYYTDDNYVEQKIESINKTLPRGKQAVRGRGKYKNKIVSRNTHPSNEEVSRYTAHVASRAVSNNMEQLCESDDLETMLQQLIMEEMLNTRPNTAPPVIKKVGKPKKEIEKWTEQEQEQEHTDDDYDDDENNYQFDENDFE